MMETNIKGGFGYVEPYKYPKNTELISQLISLGKSEIVAQKIVARLQHIRHKNGFFLEDFRINYKKKLSFFTDCLQLLKDNNLPPHSLSFRDVCIIRLVGPFFMFQRKQRMLRKSGKSALPELEIEADDIWDIMEKYEIPKYFVKELYYLHDSDMDGGFFDSIFKRVKDGKNIPRFMS